MFEQRPLERRQGAVIERAGGMRPLPQPVFQRGGEIGALGTRHGRRLLVELRLDGCGVDHFLARHQGDAIDEILELADIAAPGLADQHRPGIGCELMAGKPFLLRLDEEMPRQRLDVVGPFAQGWKLDRHHVEAIEQILAEGSFGDHGGKVAIGGGDDAHVDFHFLAPAHAADAAGLERAEQPGLRVGRHVADLVEEQGAAAGLLELADIARDRPAHARTARFRSGRAGSRRC